MSQLVNTQPDVDVDAASVDVAGETAPPHGSRPGWLFAVAAVALGFLWPGGRDVLADMAAELVMIVLLFMAVTRTAVFSNWWQEIPVSARRIGKFVVVAMVFVQFFSIAADAFPLTQWTMYTRTTPDVAVAYELVGYTAAGDEVAFVPSMTNRTMSTKMPTGTVRTFSEQLRTARLDPSDPAAIEQADQELAQVIGLLVDLHNRNSPESAVVEVAVLRTAFTTEQRRAGEGVTDEVWRQEVGSP